jgi:hypothetical protein
MWLFRRRATASTVVTFMVTAAPASPWDAALNHYGRVRATWGVHLNALNDYENAMPKYPASDPEHERLEELSGAWCHRDAAALRALIDVPSPTMADAILKLELCLENGENAEPALADLRRLTGIPKPALDILEDL